MDSTIPKPAFTQKQGQYLAFIHAYTLAVGQPPAEADMQRFFAVSPPSVHHMVLTLESLGFISRKPRSARSIKLRLNPDFLPKLEPVISSVQRY